MTDTWKTAAEWAALGLPDLPSTERGFQRMAARCGLTCRPRSGRGGGVEYPLSALPDKAQTAFAKTLVKASSAAIQLPLPLPDEASLAAYQRTALQARAALLAEIDRLILSGLSQGRAVETLVQMAAAQTLPPDLQRLVPQANARANGSRALSRSTVYNWIKARAAAGGAPQALAPAAAPKGDIPIWAETLLRLRARPQNPGLAEVLEAWPSGVERPSYDQARRFLKRLDPITRNTGRMGPKALQALRAYTIRDTSELWPGAVFIGDGHTFKAEVSHPIHGRPFRPEITSILDVFTRRWVGWSAALAENTWSVADALRHAAVTATVPDILYYDNGSGAKNRTWDDDALGLAARLGITKLHSAPWTSQSRGVIERFNSTVLHKLARRLPTYVGQRMDEEAARHAYKITRADIKARGSSRILIAWDAFLAMVEDARTAYNARPHSSLPKVLDPETGKRRHLSPDEMWAHAVQGGWQPDPITADQAAELFLPVVEATARRGMVRLFGNQYFAPELELLGGEQVAVGYDLHDPSRVWVRDMDGRFVCTAIWNGNRTSYVPVSFAEHARNKRIEGKVKRLDAHRDVALAEGSEVIPGLAYSPVQPVPEIVARRALAQAAPKATKSTPQDERRARFARAQALLARLDEGETLSETDAGWLMRYRATPEYRAQASVAADLGGLATA